MKVRESLIDALEQLCASEAELNELDSWLGDGDLGVTVSTGSRAVIRVLQDMDDTNTPAQILSAAAYAFGSANPSTYAALVQGALLSASKLDYAHERSSARMLLRMLEVSAESIARAGKAQAGDKTVLDPLLASIDVLRQQSELGQTTLVAMAESAAARTAELRDHISQRGRAAWLQERSIGRLDPGSVAYVRFLRAMAANAH